MRDPGNLLTTFGYDPRNNRKRTTYPNRPGRLLDWKSATSRSLAPPLLVGERTPAARGGLRRRRAKTPRHSASPSPEPAGYCAGDVAGETMTTASSHATHEIAILRAG